MKKMMALIISLSVLLTISVSPVVAESEQNINLNTLASSLGVDTDIFCFSAKDDGTDIDTNIYHKLFFKLSNHQKWNNELNYGSSTENGHSFGMSSLMILNHNGLISPSDIQNGALSLKDITYSDEVEDIITDYLCIQPTEQWQLYTEWLHFSLSYEEKIDRLIETAEKSMAENKYFLITVKKLDFSDVYTGIGIADGSWNFNGYTYDKCILTIDPDSEVSSPAFDEMKCIYVNSESKKCTIPKFADIMDEESNSNVYDDYFLPDILTMDDDLLLSSLGTIKPAKQATTDFSKCWRISGPEDGYYFRGTLNIENSGMVTSFNNTHVFTVANADKVISKVEEYNPNSGKSISFPTNHLTITATDYKIDNSTWNGISTIETEKNKVHIVNDDKHEINYNVQYFYDEGTYSFAPHYNWNITGYTDKDIYVEFFDNGILLSGSDGVQSKISVMNHEKDDSGEVYSMGNYVDLENNELLTEFYINSKNSIFITYNNNDELKFMINDNDNGVYDTEVKKGDVDCDGNVDASDASAILSAYSDLSTGKNTYLNDSLADFNNDGMIDASDASDVLAEYARLSTT